MKNLYEVVVESKDRLELIYETIATRATAIQGSNVSKSKVETWFDKDKLKDFGTLLEILELRVVKSDDVCVPPETFKSLKSMAKLGIDHL